MSRRTAHSDVISRMVGAEIRRARKEAGLTQVELAKRLGVTPPYVANLEAGRANPTVGHLAAVADALPAELRLQLAVEVLPDLAIPGPRAA